MTIEMNEPAEHSTKWFLVRYASSFVVPPVCDVPPSLVKVLQGERMATRDGLFAEFASALQFPGYFGANWPALSDCLDDLGWLGDFDVLDLIITEWPMVLSRAPRDLGVLRRILSETGENWFMMGRDGAGVDPVSFTTTALI